jgi:phytoene dehydrogenase-like protein
MGHDVVVVGGGIGGLTVAALLAARGVNTCLLERQSQVGGCTGRIEFSGYDFEPGMGLYTSWGPGEIYEQIFSELPVESPEATLINSDYVVRLGRDDISLKKDDDAFFDQLRRAFPECPQPAVDFYQLVGRLNTLWSQRAESGRGVLGKTLRRFWSNTPTNKDLELSKTQTTLSLATTTSPRFQTFIDAQLKAILQTSIDRCAFLPACLALSLPRSPLYSISGGTASLAECLAQAIKSAGGLVRLNTPVLRLAYDETGIALGVDLLSGETVNAKHAIISNLTVWDTYGKLVGLNRTPARVKNQLANIESSGVYVIYAAIDDLTAERMPARNFLCAGVESKPEENLSTEFTISISEATKAGKRPATIKTTTNVEPWFSFQASEEDYEDRDQQALERFWQQIHRSLPELGAGIEVIETANPRTYYDLNRRKLGMVMGFERTPANIQTAFEYTTSVPNLFLIGDTMAPTFGLASIVNSALSLAKQLTK